MAGEDRAEEIRILKEIARWARRAALTDNDQTVGLLRSIDRRLALLTGAEERKLRAKLRAELLRTSARMSMFDSIDGRAGSPELAKAAGVTDRAAQLFV